MAVNPYILGRVRCAVVAPVVVASLARGGEAYVHHGTLLPADTLPSQIDMLLERGLIRPIEEVSE